MWEMRIGSLAWSGLALVACASGWSWRMIHLERNMWEMRRGSLAWSGLALVACAAGCSRQMIDLQRNMWEMRRGFLAWSGLALVACAAHGAALPILAGPPAGRLAVGAVRALATLPAEQKTKFDQLMLLIIVNETFYGWDFPSVFLRGLFNEMPNFNHKIFLMLKICYAQHWTVQPKKYSIYV